MQPEMTAEEAILLYETHLVSAVQEADAESQPQGDDPKGALAVPKAQRGADDREGAQRPRSLDSEGAQRPRSLDSEGAQAPRSLDSEAPQAPRSLDSEVPRSLDSEVPQAPRSLDSEGAQAPRSLDSEAPRSLDSEVPQAPRSLEDLEIRRFAALLVSGVRRSMTEIDEVIGQSSKNWRLERMTWVDRNLLRLATFELREMKSVPAKVVLNEAIELAKRFGTMESPSFINGVLDRIMESQGRRA